MSEWIFSQGTTYPISVIHLLTPKACEDMLKLLENNRIFLAYFVMKIMWIKSVYRLLSNKYVVIYWHTVFTLKMAIKLIEISDVLLTSPW